MRSTHLLFHHSLVSNVGRSTWVSDVSWIVFAHVTGHFATHLATLINRPEYEYFRRNISVGVKSVRLGLVYERLHDHGQNGLQAIAGRTRH